MNERDKETIKLVATILGNIAAISFGVALFEHSAMALGFTSVAGILAYMTIRGLK